MKYFQKYFVVFILLASDIFSFSLTYAQTLAESWYMAGANPQRTSWINADISGVRGIEWYRPIEAYIDQKTQIVTAYGNIYIATAKGVIALNAETGELVWRFDTELPLGHTPTVVDGNLYIGGYDRNFYAINALTGQSVWTFSGAGAGYSVSPLVVNSTVYAGNRDGYFYALDTATGICAGNFRR